MILFYAALYIKFTVCFKYSNHLNNGQVCYSNGPNLSSCQNNLKIVQKSRFYGQKYPVLNDLPNHVIRLFENWTKMCPKSQMFGFQMYCIQMVTVSYC